MNDWVFFGKSGNPSSDITKSWFKNHAIPCEERSIYLIQKEELEHLIKLVPGGAKALVYPDEFSFTLIEPLKKDEQIYIRQIQQDELSEREIIELLAVKPYLMITPIITNFEKVLIGYDYEKLVSTFRFVKVRDVHIA